MDIKYLLWLQDLRNASGNVLTPFFEWISLFAVTHLVMIPAFIYWGVDKRKGLFTMFAYSFCCAVNAVVKLCVCAYRPWIRDSRVLPAGDSITTATGYSFPSGHTSTAGAIYGGIAVTNWKDRRWISIIAFIAFLLTGFSRNYLGVHTPQDVGVATLIAVITLYVTSGYMKLTENDTKKEDIYLLAGVILGFAAIAFITFKSYPMDYVDGKLLVDPQKMMNDGYGDIAKIIAFCIARYVEKKWIRFESTGLNGRGIILCAVGLAGLWAIIKLIGSPLYALLGEHWGHFAKDIIRVFYIVALYPAVIKLFSPKVRKKA